MHVEVDFGGETWEYDPDSLLLSELLELKRVTGMTRREWNEALLAEDVEAVQGLIYILRRRKDSNVRITDVDGAWSSWAVREVADPGDKRAKGAKRPPLEAAS